ncbi:rhodanese-like domain-containing protein [Chloroflexota bacterium]
MNMKKFTVLMLSASLIIGAVLAFGCAVEEIETSTQRIEDVTAQEAFTLIQDNQNNPDFVIIDVRTPEEYAKGHIENAVNIDYSSENFQDEIDKLDRSKTYLIHCQSGRRSAGALNIMKELNFTTIYHIYGGMLEWTSEELPTVE